jgi:signal transduction histidine kinase
MSHSGPQRRHDSFEILCHEVRGTVAPLAHWAWLLHKRPLRPEDVDVLAGVLHRTVVVLSRLAEDLAALENPQDAEFAMSFAAIDLREAVSSVIPGVAPEAARKDVALTIALPSEPVPVLGDFVRLTQVVTNLLDNALKFTEPLGAVSVELHSNGRLAELAVCDTGAGIAPDFLPLAFDKFLQEHRGAAAAHPGVGLGLHVVKDIVTRHGGTVAAESGGHGRGSRFTVVLPLAVTRVA